MTDQSLSTNISHVNCTPKSYLMDCKPNLNYISPKNRPDDSRILQLRNKFQLIEYNKILGFMEVVELPDILKTLK